MYTVFNVLLGGLKKKGFQNQYTEQKPQINKSNIDHRPQSIFTWYAYNLGIYM